MRILWITNSIFPQPSKVLGLNYPVFGGWMFALAKHLNSYSQLKLAVATVYDGKNFKEIEIEGVVYYLLPSKSRNKYQKSLEFYWKVICNRFCPDLIHIHGTEHMHGLACLRACPNMNYVISIQGLISVCSKHFFAGIRRREVFKNITLRDCIKLDSLFQENRRLRKRVTFENEYLLAIRNIIGRTSWDYAHLKAINPEFNYHFCNEILRETFYNSPKWDVSQKNNYTIFISQAILPLKGFHQVVKALVLLIEEFPLISVRISGPNIIKNGSFIEKVKRGGYARYIQNLIYKSNLQDKVFFTGPLMEEQMISEYRYAHLFICPSSIENSPNSLGEAQLVGVPTISAYVGGIPDMVTHRESGLLYRFEEVEMLAENIREIFLDDQLAVRLSKNGIKAAEKRHDKKINVEKIMEIYNAITGSI